MKTFILLSKLYLTKNKCRNYYCSENVTWLIVSIRPAERRKAANQPEAISADELKSLLALTRERFLDHFDVLTPKAVVTQTDTMKAAGMVNGKGLSTLNFLVVVIVCI